MLGSGLKGLEVCAPQAAALQLVGISRDTTSTDRYKMVIVCFRAGRGQNLMASPPSTAAQMLRSVVGSRRSDWCLTDAVLVMREFFGDQAIMSAFCSLADTVSVDFKSYPCLQSAKWTAPSTVDTTKMWTIIYQINEVLNGS
jgi:hypothetical protein